MNIVQQIALAIWRWLTPQIEGILDPEYKAKLEKLRADEAAWEQKISEAEDANKASQAAYQTSLAERNDLNRRLADSERIEEELKAEEEAVKKRIEDRHEALAKLNQAVLDRSDDDAFAGGVPKSKNP